MEKVNTTDKKQLAYEFEFKDFIRMHPGIIDSFNKILSDIELSDVEKYMAGSKFEDGKLKLTLVRMTRVSSTHTLAFKAEVGKEVLFVKVEKNYRGVQGFSEYQSARKAKNILKDIAWVEVIEPKLGYQDESGRSYFVSKWLNLPRLDHYMLASASEQEKRNLQKEAEEIEELLPNFHDMGEYNMFYDPVRKKIVLFDLDERSENFDSMMGNM